MPEQSRFRSGRISLYFTFLFFTALTFFSSGIPLFWDGDLLSREAHFYFNHGISGFILPHGLDRDGTPLLFALYLAGVWKLLGKTLLITHLALLPVLLGIAWEYFKLSKKFLSAKMIPFAMLLLLFEPTFIAQSIYVGYDVALPYFFLLALNALLDKRNFLYGIALALLGLCSIRGIMLGITLLVIHAAMKIVTEKKFPFSELNPYIFPFIVLSGFASWHLYKTGWFYISPSPEYIRARVIVSMNMMVRQGIYVLWYIADFGRAFIIAFITAAFLFALFIRKIVLDVDAKRMTIIIALSVIMHVVFLSPFSNPIAHRYFLNIVILLPLALCFVLERINLNRRIFTGLYLFFCLAFVTGNFWIYGGGFSNGWDSSLKSLPYFRMRTEMMEFVREQKINPLEIGSRFPVFQGTYYNDLTPGNFEYSDIGAEPAEKFRYVLLSNISNQFTVPEKEKLNNLWIPVREMRSGQVYVKLMKNPVMN